MVGRLRGGAKEKKKQEKKRGIGKRNGARNKSLSGLTSKIKKEDRKRIPMTAVSVRKMGMLTAE